MTLRILSNLIINPLRLTSNCLKLTVAGSNPQVRQRTRYPNPSIRPVYEHLLKKTRVKYEESLTPENEEFIQEMIQAKYGKKINIGDIETYAHTPLKQEPVLKGKWKPNIRRSGVIAQKIGVVPLFMKRDGKSMWVTMLQIVDNHVIKYIPPEEYHPPEKRARRYSYRGKMGCLVVGAVNSDPSLFTKEYSSLFNESGVMPKKILTRFPISPEAAIQPGTPLYAAHFSIGDRVDVTGYTIYHGFQGVMKRYGFKGGRTDKLGVTKNHRRPGNIGGGGEKARVWPGKEMPGHKGNRLRRNKSLTIWRINHKHNVLYVSGNSVPGDNNSFVYIYDTLIWNRRRAECKNFPTYYPEEHVNDPLPEEEYHDWIWDFREPTLQFEPEKVSGKKKK